MEQISPHYWTLMYFGVIFTITCAELILVYILSDSSNPPAGLGLYTVYFMAALLWWIAIAIQQGPGDTVAVNVPSVAAIISAFILFLAAGQRGGTARGRVTLGALCVGVVLSVFFLSPASMFATQMAAIGLFFAAAGVLCTQRGWRRRNIGDAIIAVGASLVVLSHSIALYQLHITGDLSSAQTLVFSLNGVVYALIAIGFLASVLIEYQQHLSHLATQDALTGLLNRRGAEDALHLSLAQAARQGLATAALSIDVDHFRRVNDNFGNAVGDQVIRQLARILERESRATDVVARTGGEEFLLVLPQTHLDNARVLAERIRSHIGGQALLAGGQRVPVTVSIGVACINGEANLDIVDNEASRALHLAKRGGGDQVASVQSQPLHFHSAAS